MNKRFLSPSAALGVVLAFVPAHATADPVLTFNGSISTNENTPIDFSISSLVTSTDPITGYTIFVGPFNGSLVPGFSLGDFIYTPTSNYFGPDSFTFVATDSLGDVGAAVVSIKVNEINLPPLVSVGMFGTTVNTPLEIALSTLASPVNGVPIVSYAVSTPMDGTIPFIDPSSGILFYEPNTGFQGLDQFFWTATARNGLKAESFVLVSVEPAISSVPEPKSSSLLLFSTGLLGLVPVLRRFARI